jgi:prepilin-type N-terminal cleavage/methylation domain-containing protein
MSMTSESTGLVESGRKRGAFSLIELLVVIAIIVVLASLLLAAVAKSRRQAHITKARTDIQTLVAAFSHYYNVYGMHPVTGDGVWQLDETLVNILRGDDIVTVDFNGNSRTLLLREFKERELDAAGRFVDPWGVPYFVVFDVDLDGRIVNPFDPTVTNTAAMFIWSAGPDRMWDDQGERSEKNVDNVRSF